MKKLALLATLVAAVAFGVMASSASANDPNIVAEEKGFACGVFDREGGIDITFNSRSYLLANGKEVLHCIGTEGGKGDTIVTFSGFACGMVFTGISTDPKNTNKISRLGQSQLWCYGLAVDDAAAGPAGALG